MQLWASLYTLMKLNGTSITFVLVLFLRKRLSCLVARAAYQAETQAEWEKGSRTGASPTRVPTNVDLKFPKDEFKIPKISQKFPRFCTKQSCDSHLTFSISKYSISQQERWKAGK